MNEAFVSIGSNIEAESNMILVKSYLDELFDVTYSSTYKTPAEGFEGKEFLNVVCKFHTEKLALDVRDILKSIEKDMGRTKDQKGMSNRIIDLDLILYGDKQMNEKGLEIPSDDIEKYMFVLEPLVEIAPYNIHPILQKTFQFMQ